jgi:hypothetical protein
MTQEYMEHKAELDKFSTIGFNPYSTKIFDNYYEADLDALCNELSDIIGCDCSSVYTFNQVDSEKCDASNIDFWNSKNIIKTYHYGEVNRVVRDELIKDPTRLLLDIEKGHTVCVSLFGLPTIHKPHNREVLNKKYGYYYTKHNDIIIRTCIM